MVDAYHAVSQTLDNGLIQITVRSKVDVSEFHGIACRLIDEGFVVSTHADDKLAVFTFDVEDSCLTVVAMLLFFEVTVKGWVKIVAEGECS